MKQNFEWISTKDRLPEKSGEYLIVTESGVYNIVNYSAKHKLFNCFDYDETDEDNCFDYDEIDEEALKYVVHDVKAWAEIPPYEEEET